MVKEKKYTNYYSPENIYTHKYNEIYLKIWLMQMWAKT